MTLRRREWLRTIATAGCAAVGSQLLDHVHAQSKESKEGLVKRGNLPLALKDYQPKSMLHVPETHVPRSRFPNIDFHSHLSWVDRKGRQDVVRNAASPSEILQVMDAKNVKIMVNLTGGYGNLLNKTVQQWQHSHTDRFLVFTE